MNRRFIIWGLLVCALCTVLWAATMLIAYTDRAYICENTGSRKGYREWFFGAHTNECYHASELERFLETDHPGLLTHRWTSYGGKGSSLIPFMTSRGHGTPGPILTLDRAMLLDTYVRSLSSEQRLDLFRVFCSADSDKIERRIEVILEEVMR